MLEGWKVSDDRLTWTFTLRPGLAFHDGAPVTAEDCIASLQRWAKADAFGKRMMAAASDLRAIDARTFELKLMGSNGWRREDITALIELARSQRMLPVIDKVLPLEQIREAERLMEEREVFGKIVVTP